MFASRSRKPLRRKGLRDSKLSDVPTRRRWKNQWMSTSSGPFYEHSTASRPTNAEQPPGRCCGFRAAGRYPGPEPWKYSGTLSEHRPGPMPGGSPMLGPTQRGVPWWEPEYPGQTPNDTEQRQPPKECPCTPGQWQPSTPTRTGYVITTKPPTDAAGNAETKSSHQGDTGHRGVAPDRRVGMEPSGSLPHSGLAGVGRRGAPVRVFRLA